MFHLTVFGARKIFQRVFNGNNEKRLHGRFDISLRF